MKIVYSDLLFFADGITLGNLIIMRKNKPPSLLAHELYHAKRQQGNPLKWWLKYLVNHNFRLEEEARAYAVSSLVRNSPGFPAVYAVYLAHDYWLNVDLLRAENEICKYMTDSDVLTHVQLFQMSNSAVTPN